MRTLAASLLVALALTAAGCSGEAGSGAPTVAQKKVEQTISSRLATTVGREPESVTCPDDLPGKVDQRMRCTLSDSGTELGVTVTVTAVHGKDVSFDVDVDDTPVDQ